MQDDERIDKDMTEAKEAVSQDKPPSIAKSTAKMSVATMFSRGTGFLKAIAIAYALGATILSDSYNTANMMPNIIFELIMGGILGSVIIPVYVQYLAENSEDETRYMINNLLNIILLLAVAVSALGAIFAPVFVWLITIREPVKATPEMILFFRIFSFKIGFYALAAVFSGVLNSHRKFTVPMAAPILNNLLVVATVMGVYLPLSKNNPDLAILMLGIGTTAGVIVMALFQLPTALKLGMGFQKSLDFRHPAVRQVGKLGLPMLGFAATFQLSNYIIYMLVQDFDGGATAYTNAMQFFQLPYAIFAVSVTTAIFPELSRFANAKDLTSFKKALSMGLRSTSFVVIPSAVFMYIMATPIISFTLEHGKFGPAGTAITASVLQSFAIALLSFSLYNMLTRVYYSLQDTKTPMKIGAISIPVQIVFNFILVDRLGVKGLPLSYALALTFSVITQLYILRKKIGPLNASGILRAMLKQAVAAAAAGVAIYLAGHGVETMQMPKMMGQAVAITGAAGVGAAVYLGIALLLKVEEVDFIKSVSRRVFRAKASAA